MSWFRRRGGGQPRWWAAGFHLGRGVVEGFSKPFVQPSPFYQLAKMLLAYPVRMEPFYYMGLRGYVEVLAAVVRDVAEEMGWEAVYTVALAARRLGVVKDPPLLAAELYPERERIAELLASYPVPKMALYLHLARKQRSIGVLWGYGERKRRAVAEALVSRGLEWSELQAVKHRRAYAELLRMAHPRPPDEGFEALWGWVVGRRGPPTQLVRGYEEVLGLAAAGRREEALARALEHRLPWEVVRSRLGGLEGLGEELLWEAAARLMSARDVALQARGLAARLGEERVAELARAKAPSMTSADAARAALGLAEDMPGLARVFAEIAWRRSPERLRGVLGRSGWRRVVALVDASGSMEGGPIVAAARILLATRRLYSEVYVFNSEKMPPRRVELESLEDYTRLTRMPDGGTPLYDAIASLAKGMGEDEALVVFTDEQENASKASIRAVERAARKTSIIIVNVAPYPADYIPKQPLSNIVALPGSDPKALEAAATLLELGKAQSEGIVEEEILDLLARQAEKTV